MALPQHLQELAAKVSNWGRWGTEDRRGTLNLIDDAAIARGIAAARQGKAFSLSMPLDEHGPQIGQIPGRINPEREMIAINHPITGDIDDFCSSDDVVKMGIQAATHWDTLAHVSYSGLLYNGVAAHDTDERGSAQFGIETFGPIVTRGVLLDVARALGVECFDDNHPITGADLDAAARLANLDVLPGDVVCVRTGQMRYLHDGSEKFRFMYPCPGLSTMSIEWLRDHDVAGVATDTLVLECMPCEDEAVMLPVHMIQLRDMGLQQGQNWVLDEIAADCATDGQYDFLLTATPLPFTRSVGGPVAPTAIK